MNLPERLKNKGLLFATLVLCIACGGGRDQTGQAAPIYKEPSELSVMWPAKQEVEQDSSERCLSCHKDIVEGYRKTPKATTSRPFTKADATVSMELGGFALNTTKGQQEQSQKTPFGTRSASASLVIGSESSSFAGFIDQEMRLLPLSYDANSQRWLLSDGYRGQKTDPFESSISSNCSACHGLNQGKPSLHGVGCDACHGLVSIHSAQSSEIDNATHHKLATAKGQGELCGHCHTHVSGRLYRFELEGTQMPTQYEKLTDGFRAFEADTVLDERIAGHFRRLSASKCFEKTDLTPKCSACHNPHENDDLGKRTKTTCLSCHEQKRPCLDSRSQEETWTCTQCHFNTVTETKTPHYNQHDHRVMRSKLPIVYWSTIPQTKLFPDMIPIHSTATTPLNKAVESALFKLLFAIGDQEKYAQELAKLRDQWPSSDATLALISYLLESGDFETAEILTDEFSAISTLSDSYQLSWVDALKSQGRLEEAQTLLSTLDQSAESVLRKRMEFLIENKDTAQAEKLVKMPPFSNLSNGDVLSFLGQIEADRGLNDVATKWFKTAINMNPYRVSSYLALINAYRQQKNLTDALEVATHGIKFNQDSTELRNERGLIYYESGQLNKAVKDWETSLVKDRNQFDVYAHLIRAAIETGDKNSAVTVFKAGKKQMPADPRWSRLERLLLSPSTSK